MKVVVDTNVFIKALFFNEKYPLRLLQMESCGDIKFVMSNETQSELSKTIHFIAESKGLSLKNFRQPYLAHTNCLARTELVIPKKKFDISIHNSDNKFIDCAVAGGCEYIIIDKKLKTIQIVSPYQLY